MEDDVPPVFRSRKHLITTLHLARMYSFSLFGATRASCDWGEAGRASRRAFGTAVVVVVIVIIVAAITSVATGTGGWLSEGRGRPDSGERPGGSPLAAVTSVTGIDVAMADGRVDVFLAHLHAQAGLALHFGRTGLAHVTSWDARRKRGRILAVGVGRVRAVWVEAALARRESVDEGLERRLEVGEVVGVIVAGRTAGGKRGGSHGQGRGCCRRRWDRTRAGGWDADGHGQGRERGRGRG